MNVLCKVTLKIFFMFAGSPSVHITGPHASTTDTDPIRANTNSSSI